MSRNFLNCNIEHTTVKKIVSKNIDISGLVIKMS